MTISNTNFDQLSLLNNTNLNNSSVNKASAENQLAAVAFQKIYQMLLEKNMSSNAYDISDTSDFSKSNTTFNSSDISDIWSSLLMAQQMSMLNSSDSGNMANYLNLTGSMNMGSTYGYSALKQSSFSPNELSGDLGVLSAKYESNGNPGVISNNPGDPGGKSYGAWQFSSKMGSLDSFLGWLKGANPEYHSALMNGKSSDGGSYGANFDGAWTSIASKDRNGFLQLQQSYVKTHFYDAAADKLKSKYGFDINSKSDALKNVLWSTVVQHGVGGALNVFSKINLNNSDGQIITDVYNERQRVDRYFSSSSSSIKRSVFNRFTKEKQEALDLLNSDLA